MEEIKKDNTKETFLMKIVQDKQNTQKESKLTDEFDWNKFPY